MRVVPRDTRKKIDFYRLRIGQWAERAEQIGTSPELVAELAGLTEEAHAAYVAYYQAKQAARSAKQRMKSAVRSMGKTGSSIILQVRSKADTTGDGVYPLASIPVPETPAPIGPPGKPEEIRFKLMQNGWLELRWRCKNPRGATGTMYWVWRTIQPGGERTYVGSTGKKRFIDTTLPAGAGEVVYLIRGVRGGKQGEAADFNIMFNGVASAPMASQIPHQTTPPPGAIAA